MKYHLSIPIWRKIHKIRNKTFAVIGEDGRTSFGDYSQYYPVQNFNYKFNSWGMRDNIDYTQFYKNKVILCIGDSFTVNVGGPFEHSWPYLLKSKFNLPVINYSINRLGTENYIKIAEHMNTIFDVQHTFLMYNLHGDEIVNKVVNVNVDDTHKKSYILKKYEWVHNGHAVFIPPWTWEPTSLNALISHFPDAHAYIKDIKILYSEIPYKIFICLVSKIYYEIKSQNWPLLDDLYYHLIKFNTVDNLLDTYGQYMFNKHIVWLCKAYFYRNRDFRHFSLLSNQMVADYFYNKTIASEIIIS